MRSSPMTDDWLSLTSALRQTMRSHAPGWTDGSDSDPGTTILEVIAYLAETQVFHSAPGTAASSAAARAIAALEGLADREPVAVVVNGEPWRVVDSLTGAGPGDAVFTVNHSTGEVTFGDGVRGRVPEAGSILIRYREGTPGAGGNTTISVRTTWPPAHQCFGVALRQSATQPLTTANAIQHWGVSTRPNYFPGKIVGAQDFQEEQQYHLSARRRHLQTLHGAGIARGLGVSISSDGMSITVEPGLAIDPSGHEIAVDTPVVITPGSGLTSPFWLVVEYAERGIDLVPTANREPQASRIQEGCHIALSPSPGDSGVTLARLVREANAWGVDPTFTAARAR